MCIQFACTGCSGTFIDHCSDKPADSDPIVDSTTVKEPPTDPIPAAAAAIAGALPNQPTFCEGPTWATEPKQCKTCICVQGAISKLRTLVFQAPFLATEGLSGLDKLAAWERDDVEKLVRGRKPAWDDKAESREERHKIHERINKMGLGGAVDARGKHQGFEMAITPPKLEGGAKHGATYDGNGRDDEEDKENEVKPKPRSDSGVWW